MERLKRFAVVGFLLAFVSPTVGASAEQEHRTDHEDRRVIHLPNPHDSRDKVEQLNEAVKNPANAGARLLLASGTWTLTEGLVLQRGMELVGHNRYVDRDGDGIWDARTAADLDGDGDTLDPGEEVFAHPRTETKLDTKQILANPRPDGAAAGSIEVGNDNVIASLTITNSEYQDWVTTGPNDFRGKHLDANIAVLLPTAGGGTSLTVVDCVLERHQRGVVVWTDNLGAGTTSNVVLRRNIIRFHRPGNTATGHGLHLGNGFPGPRSTFLSAVLENNRIYANGGNGIFALNQLADDSTISVRSIRNIYDRNLRAWLLFAGRNDSSRNSISMDSIEDRMQRHSEISGADDPANPQNFPGAVLARVGERRRTDLPSNDNVIALRFFGTVFQGNTTALFGGKFGTDIRMLGARDRSGNNHPGCGNVGRYLFNGVTTDRPDGRVFIDSQNDLHCAPPKEPNRVVELLARVSTRARLVTVEVGTFRTAGEIDFSTLTLKSIDPKTGETVRSYAPVADLGVDPLDPQRRTFEFAADLPEEMLLRLEGRFIDKRYLSGDADRSSEEDESDDEGRRARSDRRERD